MDALDQTNAGYQRLPGLEAEPAGGARDPHWFPVGAGKGMLGVLVALVATLGLVMVIMIIYAVAGVSNISDNKSFEFIATLAGDFALVATAWGITAEGGPVDLRTFGFRRFKPSALGWTAVAFAAYLILAGIYSVLVNPPPDKLPDELGADESTLLAVFTGIFVIVVAPFAEEFFFRGFLFQALRRSAGTWAGAFGSAVIFSAIHFAPDKFVQLAILGMALALLFDKTDSLWPCILLHALNNTLAFAVTV
jgi:membrane protease YdiL (CAAX protease family)